MHSELIIAAWYMAIHHALQMLCRVPQAFLVDYEVAAFDMCGSGVSKRLQACGFAAPPLALEGFIALLRHCICPYFCDTMLWRICMQQQPP